MKHLPLNEQKEIFLSVEKQGLGLFEALLYTELHWFKLGYCAIIWLLGDWQCMSKHEESLSSPSMFLFRWCECYSQWEVGSVLKTFMLWISG